MKEVLIDQLLTTWPRIFAANSDGLDCLPPEQRISCGDGWFPIIAALCEGLQWETDHEGAPQIVAGQVKSKMGSMRFGAFGPRSERQAGMIQLVNLLSARIAEDPVSASDEVASTGEPSHCACTSPHNNLPAHAADVVVRIARAGGGPIVIGENLGTDAVVRIVESTPAPVTVKARNRTGDALVRIAKAGGSRVTFDFS
ncbi:hypothetical protein [Stenotrophomonas sp. YIM B06876]|uniref:hypothetical protein n=1 Tax=Stenotrophomonas sp. YIM B06876 TaxID=3060211 RepID=UPI0027394C1A|nr:hypothetical protein [Stenotrophomonas sp. YIM B06876]